MRLQRQKVILNQRLKVPPAIAQFSHTLDKNTATQLFRLLNKYRPETKQEKKARLDKEAAAIASNDGKKPEKDGKKPLYAKMGLNHCVALIEVSWRWRRRRGRFQGTGRRVAHRSRRIASREHPSNGSARLRLPSRQTSLPVHVYTPSDTR